MKDQAARRGERGVTTVEYAILVAGILVMSSVAAQYVGSASAGEFTNAQAAFENPKKIGDCPNGWDLIIAGQTKKNGKEVDSNQDGFICRKDIPGKGKGNTGQNQNVKDNK